MHLDKEEFPNPWYFYFYFRQKKLEKVMEEEGLKDEEVLLHVLKLVGDYVPKLSL